MKTFTGSLTLLDLPLVFVFEARFVLKKELAIVIDWKVELEMIARQRGGKAKENVKCDQRTSPYKAGMRLPGVLPISSSVRAWRIVRR